MTVSMVVLSHSVVFFVRTRAGVLAFNTNAALEKNVTAIVRTYIG